MKLEHEIIALRTTHPFVIARGGSSEYRVVRVTITDRDGATGWGEAAPSKHYGETADTVVAALPVLAPVLEDADAWSLEALEHGMAKALRFNASARAAVSAALHDLAAKRLGVPLYKLWGLDPAASPPTSFTIGIAPDEATLRTRVQEAASYPVLKIKLGSSWDARIMRIVREMEPAKVLRVDANAAWTPKHALEMIPLLKELGVEFVEQPLPAHDIVGLRFVRDRSALPIVADESCLVSTDIPALEGAVDGINIKLAKCGGLREALRMIATARAHGMLVMCGCMVESSLGITAAAHLAPLLDCADLDGAALVANDPYRGATIAGGKVVLPSEPGLGVRAR
ncbi:MAG TPA: dipeptide epimerase [Gemmatimonadaceae bacterium]|jgi:L-alanine-DL-glutamate epimerase-like enolase superfamily enzyme|nr:dipeptide epimerase [Gemmatimonadaceae bacterium]